MDVNNVTTLIGSFGFPIFMCLLMAWYIYNTHKQLVDSIYQLNRTLKAITTTLKMEDNDDE